MPLRTMSEMNSTDANVSCRGMSPSEVECCFRQILMGVGYLHSQGVAHRDIKPENLFFDTKGHLKVWRSLGSLKITINMLSFAM